MAYNQQDCVALERVVQFLYKAVAGRTVGPHAAESEPQHARLAYLDDNVLKSHWNYRSPLFPDFDYINRCAYFDYQRDHVFVRQDKRLPQAASGTAKGKTGLHQGKS